MWVNWSQLCKMAASNLRKTFLTSKLLSREYRYDVIREFLHSNFNFGKYLSHIQILLDQHKNPHLLLVNWTLNVKTFFKRFCLPLSPVPKRKGVKSHFLQISPHISHYQLSLL